MKQESINLGVRRGLSQCASDEGVFCILALDHRRVLTDAFSQPGKDAIKESIQLKKEIIKFLTPHTTAFLLDPTLGTSPSIADNTLNGKMGLIVTVEESGYAGTKHSRVSRLPEHWSVEKIKRLGASAVKLLIYYNPRSETTSMMKDLLAEVSEDCRRCDIPLFLEILIYATSLQSSPLSGTLRTNTILESIEDLTRIGGDVLKVEFPVDKDENKNIWEEACVSISQITQIPWVLLSAGVDYEVFKEQTQIACNSGASGILAGRAIWKEALNYSNHERINFLDTIAMERMRQLSDICRKTAKPWTDFYPPISIPADWQKKYQGFSI
jgi:tagatose 1,6-diphosphate aldolase